MMTRELRPPLFAMTMLVDSKSFYVDVVLIVHCSFGLLPAPELLRKIFYRIQFNKTNKIHDRDSGLMLSLLSFAVSKSTHHLTLHAVSNFRHIASQRNSITSLKMTPNVVRILHCDSLTHGSSPPPSFSSFPYGPHLEQELNQSIDDVTRLIMARSRYCYCTSQQQRVAARSEGDTHKTKNRNWVGIAAIIPLVVAAVVVFRRRRRRRCHRLPRYL